MGICMNIIGGLILLVGVLSLLKALAREKRYSGRVTAKITGVQVGEETAEAPDGHVAHKFTYTPSIEFTVDGQTVSQSAGVVSKKESDYHVGDDFPVKYDPARPCDFLSAQKSNGIAISAAIMVLGAALLAAGFFVV